MLAVIGIAALAPLKQLKSDLSPFLRLGAILLLTLAAAEAAAPLLAQIRVLTDGGAAGPYAELLLKALGLAVLTQCCAEICRECGEGGIASGVELVGKTEILLLCLPLLGELLSTASAWLSWEV